MRGTGTPPNRCTRAPRSSAARSGVDSASGCQPTPSKPESSECLAEGADGTALSRAVAQAQASTERGDWGGGVERSHLNAGLADAIRRHVPVPVLLLARAGQSFALSSTPVWVQPVAAALSVEQAAGGEG